MFDVNNGPPNFPILAHSINIYYLQPIYENMGSESGFSLSTLIVEFKWPPLRHLLSTHDFERKKANGPTLSP